MDKKYKKTELDLFVESCVSAIGMMDSYGTDKKFSEVEEKYADFYFGQSNFTVLSNEELLDLVDKSNTYHDFMINTARYMQNVYTLTNIAKAQNLHKKESKDRLVFTKKNVCRYVRVTNS